MPAFRARSSRAEGQRRGRRSKNYADDRKQPVPEELRGPGGEGREAGRLPASGGMPAPARRRARAFVKTGDVHGLSGEGQGLPGRGLGLHGEGLPAGTGRSGGLLGLLQDVEALVLPADRLSRRSRRFCLAVCSCRSWTAFLLRRSGQVFVPERLEEHVPALPAAGGAAQDPVDRQGACLQ